MAGSGRVWTVIPAAGSSSRFGGLRPKPLLRVTAPDGVTAPMVQHVISRLPRGSLMVALPARCDGAGVVPRESAMRVENTSGPADTLLRVLRALPCRESDLVVTADCDAVVLDTGIVGRMIDKLQVGYEACVAVTRSSDPGKSYVNEYPFPDGFAEKRAVSQYAMVSLRAFGHVGRLAEALEKCVEEQTRDGREPHLSHALCALPGRKRALQIRDWWDWGTPESLAASGAVLAEET